MLTPINRVHAPPRQGLSVAPKGLSPVEDSYRGLTSTGFDPYGDGYPYQEHTVDRAQDYFGEDFRDWMLCRTPLPASLPRNEEEARHAPIADFDWMCMGEPVPGTHYCELHPDGDTDRKRVAARIAARNRKAGAAKARAKRKKEG